MTQWGAAKALGDEEIQLSASTSLGDYYTLGRKITVRVSGNHRLCLTCLSVKECGHIVRLDEYLRTNQTRKSA